MSSIISPETIIKEKLNFVIHAALPHTYTCARRYMEFFLPKGTCTYKYIPLLVKITYNE